MGARRDENRDFIFNTRDECENTWGGEEVKYGNQPEQDAAVLNVEMVESEATQSVNTIFLLSSRQCFQS